MSSYGINFNKPLWDPSNFMYTNFTPMYNNFGGYQMPLFGTSSVTTDSSKNIDSYENWKKEELKKQEEENKKTVFLEERDKEISKTKDLIEAKENTINAVKKAKKADGTYIIENTKLEDPILKEDGTIDKEAMKPKKKGFIGKAMEWIGSAGSALKNIGKSLIGYDENGKWSLGKCLKNIGITALAVGASFIPVIGPAIGYGLLAYGVASGVIGVAKGIAKLDKAKTEEEKEQARQDICSGAFVGISSAVGLRGLGKSVSTAARASGANTTTLGVSAFAKARTGIGKPVEIISQFARDISVNALKATSNAIKADKALIAASGGGLKGFGKAYATKVNTAIKNTNNWSKKYQEKYNELETSLNNKIADLNNKIASETNAAKKALFQEQKSMLENNLNELRSISSFKSKTEFDKLNTENSGIVNQKQLSSYAQNSRGGYEINGQSISQKRFDAFKKEMETIQKGYIKDLKKLNSYKESSMRNFAQKPDSHRRELDNYTDASVRAKYDTKTKLKNGIKTLSNKLSDLNTKISELEAKIESTTSPRKLANLRRSLNNYISQKSKVENELAICNSIKFKSLFKTSTWFKNDYARYIGGSNSTFSSFRTIAVKTITAPASVVPLTMAQWDREYSIPMFGSLTQLSEAQGKDLITQAEQQKADLEKALENLKKINTVEEWDNLKAQYVAQIEAQQKAMAEINSQGGEIAQG